MSNETTITAEVSEKIETAKGHIENQRSWADVTIFEIWKTIGGTENKRVFIEQMTEYLKENDIDPGDLKKMIGK